MRVKTVSEYIANAPKEARKHLRELRMLLKSSAPKAKEAIKWGYPVLHEERILFSYSGFKSHVNFMPTRSSLAPFKKELAKFKTGRDTIQLPHDKPIPKALIKKIAAFRVKEVRSGALWMHDR